MLEHVDKGDGDFATTADLESEQAILSVLRERRPDDALLGRKQVLAVKNDAPRTWLIDPLCGTFNYAVTTRLVAVNVALREHARLSIAAVGEPFEDAVFWTDGVRAMRRAEGRDTPLAPSARSHLVDLNLSPPSPDTESFHTTQLAADPAFWAQFHPRVVASSIALTWVATGQRAAYVTAGDVRDNVHFAAGIALCQGAGCAVTDLRGRPFGESANGLLAAADTATHAKLLDIINALHR